MSTNIVPLHFTTLFIWPQLKLVLFKSQLLLAYVEVQHTELQGGAPGELGQ